MLWLTKIIKKKKKKRCKYQRSLLQDTTNISASSQVAVCLSMHLQGRNPIWSLKMARTVLSQTSLFDQWTKLSVSHSGEGEIWRQVWWANGGIVGGKLPVGHGASGVSWSSWYSPSVWVKGCVGLYKQSVTEMTFFSVDVIFFFGINDMNDAFWKGGDMWQCHRVPTKRVIQFLL